MANGKFDPSAGLSSSGIAGTGTDKEDEDGANNKATNADEEMKDVSKKEGGKLKWILFLLSFNTYTRFYAIAQDRLNMYYLLTHFC